MLNKDTSPTGPIPPNMETNSDQEKIATLTQENYDLKQRIANLERLVTIDPLTGLLNQKGYEFKLQELQQIQDRHNNPNYQHRENDPPLNVILFNFDIDGLKKMNDANGHTAGDALIEAVGEELKLYFRTEDHLFHPHGDEMIVITDNIPPNYTDDVVGIITNRLHENKLTIGELLNLKYSDGLPDQYQKLDPTVLSQKPQFSCGFSFIDNHTDIHEAVNIADKAMYSDKIAKKESTE